MKNNADPHQLASKKPADQDTLFSKVYFIEYIISEKVTFT